MTDKQKWTGTEQARHTVNKQQQTLDNKLAQDCKVKEKYSCKQPLSGPRHATMAGSIRPTAARSN